MTQETPILSISVSVFVVVKYLYCKCFVFAYCKAMKIDKTFFCINWKLLVHITNIVIRGANIMQNIHMKGCPTTFDRTCVFTETLNNFIKPLEICDYRVFGIVTVIGYTNLNVSSQKDLVHYTPETASGRVGETICEEAAKHNTDMIVIGSRGLGKISRSLFGSVSDFVVRNANLPVMVVPKGWKSD